MKKHTFLKRTYSKLLNPLALIVATGINFSANPSHALTFNFNAANGTDSRAIAGFKAAGDLWSSLFTDNITINIDIGFQALSDGVLGQASSTENWYSYSNVRNALFSDKTSTDDSTAVSNLASGSSFPILINRTSNNPNDPGNATPYLDNNGDANNTNIRMTTANAKALSLLSGNDTAKDASIKFSDRFNWDFDKSDGISSGTFDFVGIAAHEIGHALGFISGVDILDTNSSNPYYRDDQFTYVSTMDLFRFSADSVAKGKGIIDWTASNTDKYFSIDGGTTKIVSFSTGQTYGDGRQASHWKDRQSLGILDPTSAPGELLKVTENDLRLFDVIGWNRASTSNSTTALSDNETTTSVPEPSTLVGLIVLGVGMLLKRSKRSCD